MKPESELILREPMPMEIVKAEEAEKAPPAEEKKRNWPRMLSTIGLMLGLTAIWFYFAAMITGHDGMKGPWNLLIHKSQGQYAILFTGMIIIAVLISIKMDIISWSPAQKMVVITSIFLAIHVLGLSIWQEKWTPREWLRSIGKDKPANAHPGPTALTDYKIYHPSDIKVFKLAKGEYSDHWVRPGRETGYKLQNKYGDYEIHYRDGRKFKRGEKLPQRIKEDFKIYATENCDMRILFLHPSQIH